MRLDSFAGGFRWTGGLNHARLYLASSETVQNKDFRAWHELMVTIAIPS
jgi:hypothetical protein